MENQNHSISVPVGSFETDVTTWELPDGAIARLGRGSEPQMAFSVDGKYLAIGTLLGLWVYDLATLSPVALWETERGMIRPIAFSPNGKLIAAGYSSGQIIKVLNIQNGTCLSEIKAVTFVESITFSLDNRYLAAAYDGSSDVGVWHTETGKQFARFTSDIERASFYRPICFSHDSRLIASTCNSTKTEQDELIVVWNMENEEQTAFLSTHKSWVTTLCFSPCGQFLASGGEDGTVYVWDVNTWQQVKCYSDYGDIYRIIPSYTSDGILRVAIVHYDDNGPATISVRNLENDEQLYTDHVCGNTSYFSHIDDWGNTVEFSYGTQLAYECRHESIIVWTPNHPYRRQFTHSPISFPNSMVFSQDGKTLAVEHHQEGVVLWDVESKRSRPAVKVDSAGKNQFLYKTDSGNLYVASIKDDTVTLWEADRDGTPLIEATGGKYWSAFPALAPTGTLFACVGIDSNIQVWNVQSGEKLYELTHTIEQSNDNVDEDEDENYSISELHFSQDGKFLASESKSDNVRLWDMELGKEVDTFPSDSASGIIEFSPCGQYLACSGTKELLIWDIRDRTPCTDESNSYKLTRLFIENRLSIPQECEYIEKPVFSVGGKYVACIASWNKISKNIPICLFEVESGQHLITFKGHSTDILVLAFSPDNKLLASTSHDGTVLLWDLQPYLG